MADGEYFDGQVTQRAVVVGPEGDVLLTRSGLGPWEFPGGRIPPGEDPEGALRRELHGQVGLRVRVRQPVTTVTDVWGTADGEAVYAVVFHCAAMTRSVDTRAKHDTHEWVAPAEAIDRMPYGSLETAVERAVAADDRAGEVTLTGESGGDDRGAVASDDGPAESVDDPDRPE